MTPSRSTFRGRFARPAGVIAIALAVLCACLWAASALSSVGMFSLGNGTSLRFTRGVAEVRHFYAYDVAPPVPQRLWHDFAVARGWTAPQFPGVRLTPPWFHFSTGHVAGVTGTPSSRQSATVSPANYWLMRVPLWVFILPGFVIGTLRFVAWRDSRQDRSQGFEVSLHPQEK